MPHRRLLTSLAVAVGLLLGEGAGTATATVPPAVCGAIKVKGKRYEVRADRMRCSTAKERSVAFLRDGRRPTGYTCRRYSSGTSLAFRCEHRTRRIPLFYAIKK